MTSSKQQGESLLRGGREISITTRGITSDAYPYVKALDLRSLNLDSQMSLDEIWELLVGGLAILCHNLSATMSEDDFFDKTSNLLDLALKLMKHDTTLIN